MRQWWPLQLIGCHSNVLRLSRLYRTRPSAYCAPIGSHFSAANNGHRSGTPDAVASNAGHISFQCGGNDLTMRRSGLLVWLLQWHSQRSITIACKCDGRPCRFLDQANSPSFQTNFSTNQWTPKKARNHSHMRHDTSIGS